MRIVCVKTEHIMPKGFSVHFEQGRKEGLLFVLFRSSAMLWIDGDYRMVEAGEGIYFGRTQLQSYYAIDGVEFNHDYMFFEVETEYERLLYEQITKGTLIREQVPGELTAYLSQMEKEMAMPGKYQQEVLSKLGTAFLYKSISLSEMTVTEGKKNTHFHDLYSLRLELYKKPYLDWTIQKMANSVQMSRYYFEHLYKSFFSTSCVVDLIQARVTYAKMLLSNQSIPVHEVAQLCGYKNVEHFIRQFKTHTGMSPNCFRKEQGRTEINI